MAKSRDEQKNLQKIIDLYDKEIDRIDQKMADVVTSDEEIHLTFSVAKQHRSFKPLEQTQTQAEIHNTDKRVN